MRFFAEMHIFTVIPPKKWLNLTTFYQICFFLRYTHITPVFWAQTDLTQWNHISHISRGNSGYLWMSDMCPFDCSAGRFMAPIAQSDPLGGPKMQFLGRKSIFWRHRPNPLYTIMMGQIQFVLLGRLPMRRSDKPGPEQKGPVAACSMSDGWSAWTNLHQQQDIIIIH